MKIDSPITNDTINLCIFSLNVEITSNSSQLLEKLKYDFSHYSQSHSNSTLESPSIDFKFKVFHQKIPWENLPPLTAKKQSLNCITYEANQIRYNDYYGEALSIYNFKSQQAEIYSHDFDRLHEITYLLCLSRTGKKMDLQGLHKIHAMGISKEKFNFLVMMPMKGGKTTLLLNLLKRKDYQIISDDAPIINRRGKIFSFPLRVGLENPLVAKEIMEEGPEIDFKQIYQIKRKHYGVKHLIPITAFQNQVADHQQIRKNLICLGIRTSESGCKIVRVSKIRMIRPLMANMVVGIGLPMILEYFLESGLKDFLKNSYILSSRFFASMALLKKSETFFIYMGKNIDKNVAVIESFVDSQ